MNGRYRLDGCIEGEARLVRLLVPQTAGARRTDGVAAFAGIVAGGILGKMGATRHLAPCRGAGRALFHRVLNRPALSLDVRSEVP